jgi:hypothetical protein
LLHTFGFFVSAGVALAGGLYAIVTKAEVKA